MDILSSATAVTRARDSLHSTGIAVVPDVLSYTQCQHTVKLINDLLVKDASNSSLFRKEVFHAAILNDLGDQKAQKDESTQLRSCKTCVAGDQIPPSAAPSILYYSEESPLMEFLKQVFDTEHVYRTEDKLGCLNIHVYEPNGDELNWHYDNGGIAVTILLQEPDEGGVFEYVRQARPANDASEDAALVKRVLSGEQKPEQANVRAGSLVLIRGNEHLHRVTPVHGVLPRVLAVLSYESTPGVTLNEYTRLKFFGRCS
ncbi:hypothetical protein PPROV_000812500 [Pycnococcus provasolii]|uniref:Fe2OG dioxygenase domain-containing protein n=1 Tax=Pycnococcus provasolii TaxID=41880 RepID=A0A830HUF4_9CHLO|nr:hypothetical protein PPROV_000812500 [Pycnococcus provasolii]